VTRVAAASLPVEGLVAALAEGMREHDRDRQAAVRLLIEHEYWLRRKAFLANVRVERSRGGRLSAWVDFDGVAQVVDQLRASSSETAMLRLACHLAGTFPGDLGPEPRWRWSMRAILTPLGHANARLAVEAIRYAAAVPADGAPGGWTSPGRG
jgi:hypothetical protein